MPKNFKLLFTFMLSLSPMTMNQYGFPNCERAGILPLLTNWIGPTALLGFLVSTLFFFKNKKINTALGLYGVVGIVVAELYTWYSWYTLPDVSLSTTKSIASAMKFCLPTFYFGLAVSILMMIYYIYQTFVSKKTQ